MTEPKFYKLRCFLFNVCFLTWSMLSAILFAPFFIKSSDASIRAGRPWALVVLWLLRKLCHLDYEVRGIDYIPLSPALFASKHQSAWDTVVFLALLNKPAYILKRSLLRIPLWGWYLWRMKMIAIDRKGGTSSMKQMIRDARDRLHEGRAIVIFPEGTRMPPEAPPNYQPGVAAIYSQMHVPVVPVALNSGYYWRKDAMMKRPGKIIIEFLPSIEPGLERSEFMPRLESAIETATQRLYDEAKQTER